MSEIKILDEATLGNAMPQSMVFRGAFTSGNIDNFCQTGIYSLAGGSLSCSEEPPVYDWKFSVLEVIARDITEVNVMHRLTSINTGECVCRVKRNGIWKPWRLMTIGGKRFTYLQKGGLCDERDDRTILNISQPSWLTAVKGCSSLSGCRYSTDWVVKGIRKHAESADELQRLVFADDAIRCRSRVAGAIPLVYDLADISPQKIRRCISRLAAYRLTVRKGVAV